MSSYGPRGNGADLDGPRSALSLQGNERGHVNHKTRLSRRYRRILRNVGRTLHSIAIALMPSFVLCQTETRGPTKSSHQLTRTSALDGLRGWASLSVLSFHVLWYYHPFVHYGYGLPATDLSTCLDIPNVNDRNNRIFQLPIIRLLFSGTAPVSVFFIISGFVLAHKPLKLSQQKRWIEAFAYIASATLRRGLRLYLPIIATTFFSMMTFHFGWWQYLDPLVVQDGRNVSIVSEPRITFKDSWSHQLQDWLADVATLMNPFTWSEYYPAYDSHIWTIGDEYRSSMVVFLTLPIFMMTKRTKYQPVLIIPTILYAYTSDRWDVSLFLSGVLLASIQTSRSNKPQLPNTKTNGSINTPSSLTPTKTRRPRPHNLLFSFFKILLLIISLLLCSVPDLCLPFTPGYYHLYHLIPNFDPNPHRFYPSIGAFMLVALVSLNSPLWFLNRHVLTTTAAQYFGRISYGLYLLHGPTMHIFGHRLFAWALGMTGTHTQAAYCAGFLTAYAIFLTCVVWMADIFTRVVDAGSVKLAGMAAKFLLLDVRDVVGES